MKKKIYPLATILATALVVVTLLSLLLFAFISVKSFNARALQISEENVHKSVKQSAVTLTNQLNSYRKTSDQLVNVLLNNQATNNIDDILQ